MVLSELHFFSFCLSCTRLSIKLEFSSKENFTGNILESSNGKQGFFQALSNASVCTFKLSFQQRRKPQYPAEGWIIEAGGLGGALSPPVGPGLALVGIQGGKPPKAEHNFALTDTSKRLKVNEFLEFINKPNC